MAGGGNVAIRGANAKSENAAAHVTDNALHVKVVGGSSGPTSDVNIAAVGGTPVPGDTVPVDDGGGSITIDGAVTIQEPLSVDDNGGSLTIDSAILENDAVVGGHNVFPAGIVRDDNLATLGVADNDWTDIRCNSRGAVWVTFDGAQTVQPLSVLPVRQTNQLHNAQVFDNVTTTASGTEVSTAGGRHFLVFYDITAANTPTSIRLVPQFSHDGGSNWYDYSVDQWVEMRFVPGQMPVHECCPLNYVGGEFFRLRIDAVGTTAANTFTVSAWVEVCD